VFVDIIVEVAYERLPTEKIPPANLEYAFALLDREITEEEWKETEVLLGRKIKR